MAKVSTKRWDEDRTPDDAPVWFSFDEANAWASGYNACIVAAAAVLSLIEQGEIR